MSTLVQVCSLRELGSCSTTGPRFGVESTVRPGFRAYHTTIPGLLRGDGALRGVFDVVGDFLQTQAHVQKDGCALGW
jgi:hypothetical protein